jgi:hypothetical protein
MFDFMQMANSPRSREMLFQMMSQQAGQAPPEIKEAISKVEVMVKRTRQGFELSISGSDNTQVESMVKDSVNNWIDLLSRGFQAVGYKVKIYE